MDAEHSHVPTYYAGCGQPLRAAHERRAHTARYEIDLIQPGAGGTGLLLRQTKDTSARAAAPAAIGRKRRLGAARRRPSGRST